MRKGTKKKTRGKKTVKFHTLRAVDPTKSPVTTYRFVLFFFLLRSSIYAVRTYRWDLLYASKTTTNFICIYVRDIQTYIFVLNTR